MTSDEQASYSPISIKIFHKRIQFICTRVALFWSDIAWRASREAYGFAAGRGPGVTSRGAGARDARPRVWCTCAGCLVSRWPSIHLTSASVAPLGTAIRSFHFCTSRFYGLDEPVFAWTRISTQFLCLVEFMTAPCGLQRSSFITSYLSRRDWQDESICVKRGTSWVPNTMPNICKKSRKYSHTHTTPISLGTDKTLYVHCTL